MAVKVAKMERIKFSYSKEYTTARLCSKDRKAVVTVKLLEHGKLVVFDISWQDKSGKWHTTKRELSRPVRYDD